MTKHSGPTKEHIALGVAIGNHSLECFLAACPDIDKSHRELLKEAMEVAATSAIVNLCNATADCFKNNPSMYALAECIRQGKHVGADPVRDTNITLN